MGNSIFCFPRVSRINRSSQPSPISHGSAPITLIHSENGSVSVMHGTLTVKEALIRFPSHFLSSLPTANSEDYSSRETRISALESSEQLQPSQFYVLFPLHRLDTNLSDQEIGLFSRVNDARRRHGEKDTTRAIPRAP
ncbi:hypothetical protein KP509_29G014700 [Ceratopteris richardii]|uniref:Uncharacterized protein n=1 Tax=Ceratopteris richardii TaxID=49495 RepID=A0A8T2R4Y2_CERRI|nr:hypothetical protein KP509_29G014700 [Ceratopteris richardii]